jgi:hypothetical protein
MTSAIGGLARTVGQLAYLLPRVAHPRAASVAFAAVAAISVVSPSPVQAQTSDQVRVESTVGRDTAIGGVLGNALTYVLGGNRVAGTIVGAVVGGLASRPIGVAREESRESLLMDQQYIGPPMQRRTHDALRSGFIRAASARLVAQSRHVLMRDAEVEMEIARVEGDPARLADRTSAFRVARASLNESVIRLNAQLSPLKSLLETAQRQGYDVKAGWAVFDNRLGGDISVVSTFDHWPAAAQQEVERLAQQGQSAPQGQRRADPGLSYNDLAQCSPRVAVGERCIPAPR